MIGKRFRLIGRDMAFICVGEYLAAGFIPALILVSECGRFRTQPRVADVLCLI